MPTYSDILFGKIALTNRLVTPQQLDACARQQDRSRGLTLAEVLVRQGLMTGEQARRVQKAQALTQFMRAEKIFARVLHDRGLVPLNALRAAFQEQQRSNYRTRLAQILVDRRVLRPDQVDEAVELQLLELAEETARIEEAGFGHESVRDERLGGVDEIAKVGLASDLDGSTFRSAVGPQGLMDDAALARTLPGLAAQPLPPRADESAGARERRIRKQIEATELDPANLVGAVIASRYRVLAKVGEGGMGTVYRAQHCLMDKTVALKVLHPSLVSSKSSLDRFRREIRAASRFQHKHVIQLYDAGEGEGGIFYMAMEFAEGQTLEDLLGQGPLPLTRALALYRQVLSAIAEAHKKGIVHRDLKSGNIMVVQGKAGDEVAKVTDFGLAKIAQDTNEPSSGLGGEALFKTQEGVVTGTPQYMSPEQASGEPVDHRSDLYSLGVILFELITGELPFKSITPTGFLGKHIVEPPPVPSEVAGHRGIGPELDQITLKLLEKRPADRFQTAEEVIAELDRRVDPQRLAASDRRGGGSTARDERAPLPSSRAGARSGRRGKTRVMPSDRDRPPQPAPDPQRAPVAMTLEVEGPTFDTTPPELGVTMEAPPPGPPEVVRDDPPPSTSKGLVLVAVTLLLLLAGVVGVAGYLATRLGPAGGVAQAEAVLETDPAKAVELLEAHLAATPDDAAAQALLADARARVVRADVQRLIARADQLAGEWRQGTNGMGGTKALELYRDALALADDAEVAARLRALEAELNPPESPRASPSETEAQAEAIFSQLGEALAAGKLDTAAGLLDEAAVSLRAHPQLEELRQWLAAERLMQQAEQALAAKDLSKARGLYEEAKRAHPRADGQARIDAALRPLLAELEQLADHERVLDALEAAKEHAIALEVPEGLRRLAKLAAAAQHQEDALRARFQARRQALQRLEPHAADLAKRRAETTRWERSDPAAVEPGPVEGNLAAIQALHDPIAAAVADDAELGPPLAELVELELVRARELLVKVKAAQPTPVDPQRARFLSYVERHDLRAESERRATYDWVADRLERYRTARDLRGFALADPADRELIQARLDRYEALWARWVELGDDDWAFVPGGAWTSPTGAEYELPAAGGWLSKTELTCAEWDIYLRATGRRRPQAFPGPTDQPVTWISLDDAERYCAWRSKQSKHLRFRLPSPGEWERAARADKGTAYPWGDDFADWRIKGEDHAAIAGMRLQRVKSLRKDKNDWGLWDMVGNAQELTSGRRDGGLVLKGGSISHGPDQAGAGYQTVVEPGDEVQPFVSVRLFAEAKE